MSRERRYFYDVKCDGLVRISGDLFHCPCVVTVPDLTEMPEGWEFIPAKNARTPAGMSGCASALRAGRAGRSIL